MSIAALNVIQNLKCFVHSASLKMLPIVPNVIIRPAKQFQPSLLLERVPMAQLHQLAGGVPAVPEHLPIVAVATKQLKRKITN